MTQARVAFFLPSLVGGGAERVAINLADGFASRGVSADLVVVSGRGELAGQIPPGVRLVDLGASRVILGLPALVAYLRRERPGAIISFLDHAGIIALWARRLSGTSTRVICTVHNPLTHAAPKSLSLRSRVMPRFVRAFYPSADAVVAVSHGVARGLSDATGIPLSRILVIYNPVITPGLVAAAASAPSHPWLAPGEVPVVLGVGRLTRQKDFPTLIRAFAAVRRRHAARLIILGEGEDRPGLEALAGQLGVAPDVALPGFQDNAVAYMAASRLFVLSSTWEGLPTVLIEALAAGTRVVSTDCPNGPREILQDGRLGALVPVGDVAALAAAMIEALCRPKVALPLDALTLFTRDAAVDHYLRLIGKPE
jgi:glycosyltransferase involved in cell wall biosynthesis